MKTPGELVERLLNDDDGSRQRELAGVVARWLDGSANSTDVLVDLSRLGVISDNDVQTYGIYVEPGSKEHGLIHIFLDNDTSGEIITVDADGTTDRVDNS